MQKRIAVYAGSFDPWTKGHENILNRSLLFCDQVIIAIGVNPAKKTLFTLEEREELIKNEMSGVRDDYYVSINYFEGLLVDFAKQVGANILIRGVRNSADFEFENQLAQINKSLAPFIETILLPTDSSCNLISSSAVKELARFKAPIYNMVSKQVAEQVYKKLGVTA